MKKINLIDINQSDIKYEMTVFPDGEPHIKIDDLDRKEDYKVICRITNPTELFNLMQIANILDRQGVEWVLYISYLMTQRMDRVIHFNEAFSLEIVVNILKRFKCNNITIFEAHSKRVLSLFEEKASKVILYYYSNDKCYDISDTTICYPDTGAYTRYSGYSSDSIVLSKIRDLENYGKLIDMKIKVESSTIEHTTKILVSDDLCDSGGTFAWAAKILREKYPNKELNIFVRHLVNPKGLKVLSENYDNVYFTNSYKNWDNLPDNCHMIDIYDNY